MARKRRKSILHFRRYPDLWAPLKRGGAHKARREKERKRWRAWEVDLE